MHAKDYNWIKSVGRNHSDLIEYISQENEYALKVLEPTAELQRQLEKELRQDMEEAELGRLDDHGPPGWVQGDYYYWKMYPDGLSYPAYYRKKQLIDSGADHRQLLLDYNIIIPANATYFAEGVFEISPFNDSLLAYSYDLQGSEFFDLFIKDLNTNNVISTAISNTYYSVQWSTNDSRDTHWVYYNVMDSRLEIPWFVFRLCVVGHFCRSNTRQVVLGEEDLHHRYSYRQRQRLEMQSSFRSASVNPKITSASSSYQLSGLYRHSDEELVYSESDASMTVVLKMTRDKSLLLICLEGQVTSEVRFMPASSSNKDSWTIVAPRQLNVMYSVEHNNGSLYIRSNAASSGSDKENFEVVRVSVELLPLASLRTSDQSLEIVRPHDPNRLIQQMDMFQNHIVLWVFFKGLPQIEIGRLSPNQSSVSFYNVTFHSGMNLSYQVYSIFPGTTSEWVKKILESDKVSQHTQD